MLKLLFSTLTFFLVINAYSFEFESVDELKKFIGAVESHDKIVVSDFLNKGLDLNDLPTSMADVLSLVQKSNTTIDQIEFIDFLITKGYNINSSLADRFSTSLLMSEKVFIKALFSRGLVFSEVNPYSDMGLKGFEILSTAFIYPETSKKWSEIFSELLEDEKIELISIDESGSKRCRLLSFIPYQLPQQADSVRENMETHLFPILDKADVDYRSCPEF
jgi:hypothetical protein